MSRTYKHYLNDILKAISHIQNYTSGISLDQFQVDDMRIESVLFNLITMGEAVKNLPEEVRSRIPEIQWREIGRFRDRIVHHYFDLDYGIVWDVIQNHLPGVRVQVEELLRDLENREADGQG